MIAAVLLQLAVLSAPVAAESLPTQKTLAAYNAKAARVERRFVAEARRGTPAITSTLLNGEITVAPATDDGIVKVSDGLLHHWRGAAFIPGVTLADVLRITRSYDEYSAIYDSVVASRLVAHRGNTYETLMRIIAKVREFAKSESVSTAKRLLDDLGVRSVSSSNHLGFVDATAE